MAVGAVVVGGGVSIVLLLLYNIVVISLATYGSSSDDNNAPAVANMHAASPRCTSDLFAGTIPKSVVTVVNAGLDGTLTICIYSRRIFLGPALGAGRDVVIAVPARRGNFILPSASDALDRAVGIIATNNVTACSFRIATPSPAVDHVSTSCPHSRNAVIAIGNAGLISVRDTCVASVTCTSLVRVAFASIIPNGRAVVNRLAAVADSRRLGSDGCCRAASILSFTIPTKTPSANALIVRYTTKGTCVNFSILPNRPVIACISASVPRVNRSLVVANGRLLRTRVDCNSIALAASRVCVSRAGSAVVIGFTGGPSMNDAPGLAVAAPNNAIAVSHFCSRDAVLAAFSGSSTASGN